MKRKYKHLIVFILALVFLSACQKEKEIPQAKNNVSKKTKKESPKKTSSKGLEKLKPVEGARIGSISTYVEDRQIWKDLVDKKHIGSAKDTQFGVHLPRILLDSKDADKANKELDSLEKEIRDNYKNHKNEMDGDYIGIYSSFSVYQDDKILSVMVEGSNSWEGESAQYKIYNFALFDGSFIDDEGLMKHFGIEKEEILGLVENSLREKQDLLTKTYYRETKDLSYMDSPANYTGLILDDLWENYKPTNSQIFVDEVGIPTFVFAKSTRIEGERIPENLKLKADKLDSDPISQDYLRMARRLGVDPSDKNHKAFIIYLGQASDEASLKAPLEKLYAWSSIFLDYEDPKMLLAVDQAEGGDMPYLIGSECYLLIPKYRNASISLKELELSEDGKLKEVDNSYLDYISSSGTNLICQNISDITPNAKITIRYRGDVLEFSPSISLKDGSPNLPDGVTDGQAIIDWKDQVKKGLYSETIFKRIQLLMPKG